MAIEAATAAEETADQAATGIEDKDWLYIDIIQKNEGFEISSSECFKAFLINRKLFDFDLISNSLDNRRNNPPYIESIVNPNQNRFVFFVFRA